MCQWADTITDICLIHFISASAKQSNADTVQLSHHLSTPLCVNLNISQEILQMWRFLHHQRKSRHNNQSWREKAKNSFAKHTTVFPQKIPYWKCVKMHFILYEPLGVIVDYLSFLVYRGILYHSTQNFVRWILYWTICLLHVLQHNSQYFLIILMVFCFFLRVIVCYLSNVL